MKGTEYKRILNKRTLEDDEIEVEEEPNEISKKKPTEMESTETIKAPSLSSKVIKEVRQECKVTVPSEKNDKTKKFCHFFNNGNSCKKGDICKFRHENSPRCKRVDIGLCAKRSCQFKHSEQHVFCTNQGCQLKHSEPYVMCRSRHREQYEPQKPQSLSAPLVTGEVAAPLRKPQKPQSLSAQVVTGEVAALLRKKFCHFFNNGNSCKKGDICKFRHEDSPRCEQDKDCARIWICQFKHNKTFKKKNLKV